MKTYLVVTLFNGAELGTLVTASSKAGARRTSGVKPLRVQEVPDHSHLYFQDCPICSPSSATRPRTNIEV